MNISIEEHGDFIRVFIGHFAARRLVSMTVEPGVKFHIHSVPPLGTGAAIWVRKPRGLGPTGTRLEIVPIQPSWAERQFKYWRKKLSWETMRRQK